MNTLANPSYLQVDYKEDRIIPQMYHEDVVQLVGTTSSGQNIWEPFGDIHDVCAITNTKEIRSGVPDYTINSNAFTFCGGSDATVEAVGPNLPNTTYAWEFKNLIEPLQSFTATGKSVNVSAPGAHQISYGTIKLTVTNECGAKEFTKTIPYSPCQGNGNRVAVFPSPAQDDISVAFIDPNYYIPEGGLEMRIIHANSGYLVKTGRIYSIINSVNTSTLSNGNYNLQVFPTDGSTISSSFVILRN